MFKVYNKCCGNCLLSDNRIVSEQRKDEIIAGCVKEGTHFVCHKASIQGEDVCCTAFYNQYKPQVATMQILERLGMVQRVAHKDTTILPPYKKYSNE